MLQQHSASQMGSVRGARKGLWRLHEEKWTKKEDRRQEDTIGVGVEKKMSSYKPNPFVML